MICFSNAVGMISLSFIAIMLSHTVRQIVHPKMAAVQDFQCVESSGSLRRFDESILDRSYHKMKCFSVALMLL